MDKYKYPKVYSCSPSFSSTLLDSIYHSIDKGQEKKSRNLNSNSSHITSSFYGLNNRPKPIRTSISTNQEKFQNHQYPKDLNFYAKEKAKHDDEDGKNKKSRAFKLYRELKKPISPGGRLSSFFNSIFTDGKKTKISSTSASTCSSFSRSYCLSKNIIISPCGHKNFDMDQLQNVEAIKGINGNINKNIVEVFDDSIEDEDDDEGESCASSDLFELDIFSSIGLMELPIYETTNLATNRVINANGN